METLKLKWKDITGSSVGRIMLSLFLFTALLCSTFLIYTYITQIESYRQAEIKKLKAISYSTASLIDGDAHGHFFESHAEKDVIKNNNQDVFYAQTHKLLKSVKEANNLPSSIYTLVYSDTDSVFYFAVTSSERPYYRHKWMEFSESHILYYRHGAAVGPYEDENGVWLSAFSPILDGEGKTVGLVQADEPFDSFIAKARTAVLDKLVIVLLGLGIFVFFLLHFIQRILLKEDKLKKLLREQSNVIENKNKEIVNSINRAKTIQDAILPEMAKMRKAFPEMFIMFQPRDIVSGDFFWIGEKNGSTYLAVADCTGHGVPGAFMSVMGHTLLNDVLQRTGAHTPAEILNKLDFDLKQMLYSNGNRSTDGMDIALISYNKAKKYIEFAGALRPIHHFRKGKMTKIRGDKFAIGGHHSGEKQFTNHRIHVAENDTFYMYSDGFSDQFGGEKNKKYMSNRFADFLAFAGKEHVMEDQQYLLQYEFHHWKEDEDQIDDVLVLGFKIPKAA
ncbi:MAG: PP2C family protein-serine/threonine phosphatase [Cryomorphaceae bacterium]|nr:serine/threonine-protein phosphatase [Flavobacteriales bacterium]